MSKAIRRVEPLVVLLFLVTESLSEACDKNCVTCKSDVCSECAGGFRINLNGECNECSIPNCKDCQLNQDGCKTCQKGYYMPSDKQVTCIACIQHCDVCDNLKTCLMCSEFSAMQADKTCKFNSYTMLIILVLVFGIPIVGCIVFCFVNYFRSKNQKIERRELMNNPNKNDKPLDNKNIGETHIPLENALENAAPTASPYYFNNPENVNI